MTEDQSRRPWESGYVVRGEVVAEGEPDGEQAAPVTYFHKVASAAHRDEPDPLAPSDSQDDVAAVTSPDGLDADEDAGDADAAVDDRDEVVPVTRADALASSAAEVPAAPAAPVVPAADTSPVIAAPPASTYGSLISDTTDLRSQWQQIQFMFVDDPRASVTEAADVIDQVAAKLQEAIQERQRALRGRWDAGTRADTETLRETLRMYRAFLYQLIGSTSTPGS